MDDLFLGFRPPVWVARGLATLLLALGLVLLIAGLTIQLPETVEGTFAFSSNGAVQPLLVRQDGIVRQQMVPVGQQVQQDEVVFVIESTDATVREGERQALALKNSERASERTNMLEARVVQREADEARRNILVEERAYLRRAVDLAKREYDAATHKFVADQALREVGGLSELDLATSERNADRAGLELQRVRTEAREVSSTLQNLEKRLHNEDEQHQHMLRSWDADALVADGRLNALNTELAGVASEGMAIRSPCDGVLVSSTAQIANHVPRATTIGAIRCDGIPVEAQVLILEASAGKIREGQKAWLLVDAFPHQFFGTMTGTVRWVGPSLDEVGKMRVYVDLGSQTMRTGEVDRPLLPGMTGKARIRVASRPAIQQLFAPLSAQVALYTDSE